MSLARTRRWLIVVALAFSSHLASAQSQFKVLYGFGSGNSGGGLQSKLSVDKQGNLYGTTYGGGSHKGGVVFELTPEQNGLWGETVLYDFPAYLNDGAAPNGGPILDSLGNLYGMTTDGGQYHCGVVYELTPAMGTWNETIIYPFCSHPNDVFGPFDNLTLDARGSLYGAARDTFELSRGPEGSWAESILHYFNGENGDGESATAAVILDKNGNIYGTTLGGGGSRLCPVDDGCGTVYELSPVANDPQVDWNRRILYAFGQDSGDGQFPGVDAQLAMDEAGNIFGTTVQGGPNICGEVNCGIVFELSRNSTGRWIKRTIYSFMSGAGGYGPEGGVVIDKAGNLFGTAGAGGSPNCGCGVIYRLSRAQNGGWQYTVLHTFVGSDGAFPSANMIFDSEGNLYGSTETAGPAGYGVVFELTP